MMFHLSVENLSKRFGQRSVFSNISFQLQTGDSLAVVGPNGSGKTTLLMTLLGHYRPNGGTVNFQKSDTVLDDSGIRSHTSLVSPYLNLYDNLTADENLAFFATVAGGQVTGRQINDLLARVGLEGRGSDLVGSYSSGMKQRLKYAVAMLNDPDYLFLDEPNANLDEEGKQIVADIVNKYRSGAIVIIATNEKEDQALASKFCRLDQ